MKNIALATDSDHPELHPGFRQFADVLEERGLNPEPVQWTSDTSWSDYDTVIITSTWDYVQNFDAYRSWIDTLEASSAQVWNPVDVLRWNMNKMYLKDLRESNQSIVPSVFLPAGTSVPVNRIVEEKNWSEIVIKPLVGAGASDLKKFDGESLDEAQEWLDRLADNHGAIVQEFQESIRENGEWSFVFFNREYQYAVKKEPAQDDYRVQIAHDGTREGEEAPPGLIRQAQSAVDSITKPFLYARVDALANNGQLQLIEVEMVEPDLYLEYSENGPEAFADALEDVTEQGAEIDYFDHAEIQTEEINGNTLN
ncbi:MAG: RimK family alpha-L-glutamate ligase [bacterium]